MAKKLNYSNPNQYRITIHKGSVNQKTSEPFILAYQKTIEAAAKDLNGGEFKLYIYLISNQNEYMSFFSPADVKNRYGISEDTARAAFHKLQEKGYIILNEKRNAHFYDTPKKEVKPKLACVEEMRLVKIDDGKVSWKEKTFKEFEDICHSSEIYDKSEIVNLWNDESICRKVKRED